MKGGEQNKDREYMQACLYCFVHWYCAKGTVHREYKRAPVAFPWCRESYYWQIWYPIRNRKWQNRLKWKHTKKNVSDMEQNTFQA